MADLKDGEGAGNTVRQPGRVRARPPGRIKQERAEIMRLIASLQRGQRQDVHDDLTRRKLFAPQRVADPLTAVRGMDGGSVVTTAILERMDRRLSRIEETLAMGAGAGGSTPGGAAGRDSILTGVIQGDLLADTLQLISSNELSGVFLIDADGGAFKLFIEAGQIQHAEGGKGLSGESAFFAAFACTSGHFRLVEGSGEKFEKTIDGNTQYLILEALRQIDENEAS